MKWTLADSTNEKFARIPHNTVITRRSPSLFLTSLLLCSMRKRKLGRNETKMSSFRERKVNFFGVIDSHRARSMMSSISKEELSAIQTQLAMLSDGDGDRPIHIAVANEDLKLVDKLCLLMLKNKISLDITNNLRQTPLHLAVILGNVEIIRLLLSFGASPKVSDRNGNTVLHLSVKSHRDQAVLHHLLSYPNVKTVLDSVDYEGYSALHYAVFQNNIKAVEMLTDSGADMNKIDGKSGRTPLIHAVLEQNVTMVELLLNSGACPEKTDYSGRSAFDMAIQIANVPIIKLLEKCMPSNEAMTVKEKKLTTCQNAKSKRTMN